MTIPLRQSTASQEVPLGHFLDSTDGDTEETGLTISNTDIKLWKMGATTLANKSSGGATHISNGLYYCVLNATDTNTLGSLIIFVHESGALPVRVECTVYAAHVYDSLIAATDKLEVDVVQLNSVAQSLIDLKDFADAGYDPSTNKITGTADMRGTNSAALATVCTETRLNRLDAAVSSRNATTPPTAVAIRTEVEGAGHDIALIKADVDGLNGDAMRGTNSANTTTPPTVGEIRTEMEGAGHDIALIKADTNELQSDWKNTGRLDNLLDAIPTTAMRGTDGANTTVPDAAGTLASYDPPTRAEVTSDKADIIADLLTMKQKAAGTYNRETDSLEAVRDRGDDAWVTGGGGSAPTVGEIRAEMEGAGHDLALIKADVDGLNGDAMRGTNSANTTTPPTVGEIRTEVEGAGHDIALIKADVDGLNGDAMRGTNSANTTTPPTVGEIRTELEGVGTKLTAVKSKTDNLPAAPAPASEYDTQMGYIPSDLGDVATAAQDNTAHGAGSWEGGGAAPTVGEIRAEMEGAGHDIALIKADVDGLNGDAMRGTDGANTTVPDAAGVAPTASEIQTQIEGAGSKILAIETDTNELQTDWKNTGRLDNLLDAIPTTAMRGTDGANTTTPPTAVAIRTEMEGAGHDIALIKADVDGLNGDAMVGTNGANTTTPPTVGAIRTEMEGAGHDIALIKADVGGLNGDAMVGTNGANTTTPPTAVAIRTEMEGAGHDIALIKADVDGLGGEVMRGTDGANTTTPPTTGAIDTALSTGHGAGSWEGGAAAPTVGEIRTEMEKAGTKLTEVLVDTAGLNGDAMRGTNGANTTTPPTAVAVRTEIEGAGHDIALIKADVDGLGGEVMRGTDGANTDKTGYRLSAAGVDDVIDEVIEGTLTLRKIVRIVLSVLAGKTSGGGTDTAHLRDVADAKDRITATVDANGNRTAITLDGE